MGPHTELFVRPLARTGLRPLLELVCVEHGVSHEEVTGRSRYSELVAARRDSRKESACGGLQLSVDRAGDWAFGSHVGDESCEVRQTMNAARIAALPVSVCPDCGFTTSYTFGFLECDHRCDLEEVRRRARAEALAELVPLIKHVLPFHSGSCCVFSATVPPIVTRESCCCDADLKALRVAIGEWS